MGLKDQSESTVWSIWCKGNLHRAGFRARLADPQLRLRQWPSKSKIPITILATYGQPHLKPLPVLRARPLPVRKTSFTP